MPAKIQWNDDLDDALRKLRAEGVNREECSDIMGFGWPVLRRRCAELGIEITPSTIPHETSRKAIELFNSGLTRREVAKQVGLSYHAAVGAIYRARQRGDHVRSD
jgi:hypothetical protein